MAAESVGLEEIQRNLSEYRRGLLVSQDERWLKGRGWSADLSRKGLAGFVSLALRESAGVLWEVDGGRTQDLLELHDPSLPDDAAVILTVSSRNVQFELAGRGCVFAIDAHGRIDPRVISDPRCTPLREPVQLAVAVPGAPADATFQEMLEIGGDCGFRFVPFSR